MMAAVNRATAAGFLLGLLGALLPLKIQAGGSGLNTMVVVNQASSNSLALGNYYCERRRVPPQNVLAINWTGGNISWTNTDYETILLQPLLNRLAAAQLTNQVDYVVLSMDIPFQVDHGIAINSTTSALFYGLKPDGGTDWSGITNSYARSESVFSQNPPASAPGFSFLATMITANSLTQAMHLVDQGVNSDGTFPSAPVILMKTDDPLRNIRFPLFDSAIFNTRLRGNFIMWRTNTSSVWVWGNYLGCQTGLQDVGLNCTFLPGSMADDLTSFGGIIFGYNDQSTALDFINAGAAGSYGTVAEPSPDPAKFPDPQDYFYQARGFSLAECYYQSVYNPYEGLVVAEPLAAPFALPAIARGWTIASNSVLSGVSPVAARFSAVDAAHPLQQIDLFIDGVFFQTLTNAAPAGGNVLAVNLNGCPVTYTVPANATLSSIAAGLASQLNQQAATNGTEVSAVSYGDRVELQSTATNRMVDPFFFADNSPNPSPVRFYRVSYLPSSIPPQLGALGKDANGQMRLRASGPSGTELTIEASTNLVDWIPVATDPGGGIMDCIDVNAPQYPFRFYRLGQTTTSQRPFLSMPPTASGPRTVHIDAGPSVSYGLQASTNLSDWTLVFTNLLGGQADFYETAAYPSRYYRAVLLTPPAPNVSAAPSASPNSTVLRVDGALQPYVIEVSSDLGQWTPIFTNVAVGKLLTTVESSQGAAGKLSTFLNASREQFMDSVAWGICSFSVNGIFESSSWLELDVTKTNGSVVSLSVTNQSSTNNLMGLVSQLVGLINSTPALTGPDGLAAEDLTSGAFGAVAFNLRARSPGIEAAGIQARLGGNSPLLMSPKNQSSLTANLSDLQPRNHLYVTAGARSLAAGFVLDTTRLSDGYHELSAVAYEGSNVRTQTRSILPVRIRNTSLSATFTALDFGATASAQGTYHIVIAANTNNVTSINLFGNGGLLGTATNQTTATFAVNASSLGVGLQPFYATVQTAAGLTYRTETHQVRFY